MHYLIGLVLGFFFLQHASADSLSQMYLGSREGDPASLVENVSAIHGDYTEVEVDLIVPAPDALILSRFYSSRDTLQIANFGGWRFNPHCFLSIRKDPKGKTYTSWDGKFEKTYVSIGNPDGTILTYVGWQNVTNPSKKVLFTIDPEEECLGLANTVKGNISCWTNLKNNELYFDPQTNSFELILCCEGKRFYIKHPSLDIYILHNEILPSGNKVFYEFDETGHLSFIKEMNNSEKKILAWIKIQYENGIHVESSNAKTVDYHFEDETTLLTKVTRSDKPDLHYHYQIIGNQSLLIRKTLPEGRFVQIDYYTDQIDKHKVRSVTTPTDASGTASVQFSYGDNCTEVDGPTSRKTIYRYDDDFQLIAIEQHLDGSLYRVHKKSWGQRSDASNLISTSVEDSSGNVFYYKYFVYDNENKGNIIEEREYGDIIGTGPISLEIDEDGYVTNQDGHLKNYSYFSGKTTHGFFQADVKGTGVKYWYKKGTNLLIKKFLLTKGSPDKEDGDSGIKKRYFYEYNEDAVLIKVVVDDGGEKGYWKGEFIPVPIEGHITLITPKQELPNVGEPEIIEEKYFELEEDPIWKYIETKSKKEALFKKTVNHFDAQGNIVSQAVYDSNEKLLFTITKGYMGGLLTFETDPLGNETYYSYDGNHNLISETSTKTDLSIEYGYDLQNRLICTVEKHADSNRFETQIAYDAAGIKICEVDRYGNETLYINDDLGRPIQITYPEVNSGHRSSIKPTYTFTYDLFDNPISITDPKGRTLSRAYNVKGDPVEIHHLDGTKEVFRYDSGGNLHKYEGRNDLTQVFSYDYIGRLNQIEYFKRGSSSHSFKKKTYDYDSFHKILETDEKGKKETYTYNGIGQLTSVSKDNQKVDFIYDSLGRTHAIKRWKTSDTFTFDVKEYDLLDRVIEERTEDSNGKVLIKKNYVYNDAGQLAQVIGYPQNKESVLLKYEYDGFARLVKAINASGHETTILYDDAYINEWGQKTRKRTLIDSIGNQTEEIFDADDHLLKVTKKDKAGQSLAESESFYDSFGNKILERTQVISSHPSRIYETEWSFNQKDQLESIVSRECNVKFEYNNYGDITAKYNPGSKEPNIYRYDSLGNLETLSYKEGKKEQSYKFTYDLHNNISEIRSEASFTINYSFDPNDLPLSETIKDEFGSYRVSCTYDGEGKIKTLQLPDGSSVEYTYEGPFVQSAKRLSKEKKEIYQYQVASRDLMGNILEETLPGKLGSRKQVWDTSGRRVEITTDFFQDKVLERGDDALESIKKRETTLDDEKYTIEYDFNALDQLIFEKGAIEHKYSYDSIGNRLQKDHFAYKVNDSNQLIEAEGAIYTFDLNGNLETKTKGGKTWTYQSNSLNQVISIKCPDQTIIKFTYDPSGKRLSKRIEGKEKPKVFRFFYLADTEIGCMDEKGTITELKIPSNPNHPEAPCIAIEIKKETYVPLYDLKGNIVCLLDQKRRIVESYRYSAFGEEEIVNKRGRSVTDSAIGNPWRYQGKRVDKEAGLIYFGYRFYDPEVGRWITPDPLGAIDGPNLYAYVRNNPIAYVDYFGLSSALEEECGCTEHDHPGWHNAPEGCVCICGRDGNIVNGSYRSRIGSDIKSALTGINHGVVDFVLGSLHDLQTAAVYMGSAELEMSRHERSQMIEAVEQSQAHQIATLGNILMAKFSIDQSDTVYQSFRSKTTLGLEIGSLLAGGYGAVKSVIGFSKLARMPVQITKLSTKGVHSVENVLKAGKFTYSNTAAKHFTEFVKRGPNAGRLSRPYMKSQLTINEIMAAGNPIPDPGGIPGGLRWDIPGMLRGSEGTWELVIHPETNMIYHFNFK